MANFSERLRELRKENNLGQKEVGAWIGVSDSSIRKYESDGSRTPNPEAIKILAKKFGVTTDYLLGNDLIPGLLGDPEKLGNGYYHDPEVSAIANEMKDNPDMRILFDATKGMTKEDLKFVVEMVNRIKKE